MQQPSILSAIAPFTPFLSVTQPPAVVPNNSVAAPASALPNPDDPLNSPWGGAGIPDSP